MTKGAQHRLGAQSSAGKSPSRRCRGREEGRGWGRRSPRRGEPRRREGHWEAERASKRASGRLAGGWGRGGDSVGLGSVRACVRVCACACVCVCVLVCFWRLSKVISHKPHALRACRLKGCAEGWPETFGPRKVKVRLGLFGAATALCSPNSDAALGPRAYCAAAGERRSARESEHGHRARPGPSCPYDRAGRRRALPSHGKQRPRCGARPGRARAARRPKHGAHGLSRRNDPFCARTTPDPRRPCSCCHCL